MGYGDNVEIRTGDFTIDRGAGPVDVGNVKLFSHIPNKEIHESISGKTKGVLDVKEFTDYDSMKLTLDKHTYGLVQELFGVTAVVTGASRTIVKAESFILSGSKLLGNATSLNHGQTSERPISIECIELVMQAAGYTACVAADIGKQVLGGVSTDTGNLVAYDNVTRTWLVTRDTHADVFQAEAVTIPTGIGAGTIAAAGDITPGGLFPDALQAGAEWGEGVDFDLDFHDGQVSRLVGGGMADPVTVYAWYSYAIVASATMNFPKGDTQITTKAKFIYTHALQNGLNQEIKIPWGYITNNIDITHSPDGLTEYTIEIKSMEHTADVGAEHGYDKRIT